MKYHTKIEMLTQGVDVSKPNIKVMGIDVARNMSLAKAIQKLTKGCRLSHANIISNVRILQNKDGKYIVYGTAISVKNKNNQKSKSAKNK